MDWLEVCVKQATKVFREIRSGKARTSGLWSFHMGKAGHYKKVRGLASELQSLLFRLISRSSFPGFLLDQLGNYIFVRWKGLH
jgi:hypothetical protein